MAAAVATAAIAAALPAPAAAVPSARYTLTIQYTGTWEIDLRWPDGSQARRLSLRTTWTGVSTPFTVANLGTAARPRLRSQPVQATGLVQHTGAGTEDRGDWYDVTGGPKLGDCLTTLRQFLPGPSSAHARVQILAPPAGARAGTPHFATVRLAAPGVTVRHHESGYSCTVLTGEGEPTQIVSIPDLVTDATPGEGLVLPLSNLRDRWMLGVTSQGRIAFRRPLTLATVRNGITDPVLRQELPNGGSQTYTFTFRLRLVPVR